MWGVKDVRQVLVLEALNKYHGNFQNIWACGSFIKRLAMLGRNVLFVLISVGRNQEPISLT